MYVNLLWVNREIVVVVVIPSAAHRMDGSSVVLIICSSVCVHAHMRAC